MAFDTKQLEKGIEETTMWLKQELAGLRTGRATPALLDSVHVEVYGSRMPINQTASIGVEGPRTLYVSPYDASQVKEIEKAIAQADLGVSVGADEKGVRVNFPELTAERRQQLVKIVKGKLEEARVTLKQKRTDAISDAEKQGLSEDELRDAKGDIQKVIDDGNKDLEETARAKETELETV